MPQNTLNNFDYCLSLLRTTTAKVQAFRDADRIVVTVRSDLVVDFMPSKSKGAGTWKLRNSMTRNTGVHQLVAYANANAAHETMSRSHSPRGNGTSSLTS